MIFFDFFFERQREYLTKKIKKRTKINSQNSEAILNYCKKSLDIIKV